MLMWKMDRAFTKVGRPNMSYQKQIQCSIQGKQHGYKLIKRLECMHCKCCAKRGKEQKYSWYYMIIFYN